MPIPYLGNEVGYDSDEIKTAVEFEYNTRLGLMTRWATRLHMAAEEAECSVCLTHLGPYPEDENHHVSSRDPNGEYQHYCELHCPVCNADDPPHADKGGL